jgi:hypothetical protein
LQIEKLHVDFIRSASAIFVTWQLERWVNGSLPLPCSARPKKILQKFRAFAGQNTAADLDLMIQGGVV